jgi:sugar phosphate isomerase/epimerase
LNFGFCHGRPGRGVAEIEHSPYPDAPGRRTFLTALALVVLAPARAVHAARRTSVYLAYTSFAVRLAQRSDPARTAPAALDADAHLRLCDRFGSGGAQVDFSQLPIGDARALAKVRSAFEEHGVDLELSIPARYLETPEAYATAVAAARALGATRARVALLSGRRYESFETRAAWDAFAAKWRETLPRMRREFDRHRLAIAIENHKDWLAGDLVALLRSIDSPHVGACVDFGNNVALLEDPDETIEQLAPYAVTTHLKDMAVRRSEAGFELSEVPLGRGVLPLARYIATIRAARPAAPLCLEMITRDPLDVPYKIDRYWTAFDAASRDPERVTRFEARVLARASEGPLPRVAGLSPDARVAAEDENVRVSLAYARDVLKLGAE